MESEEERGKNIEDMHKKIFSQSSPRMTTSLGSDKEVIHYNLKNKTYITSLSISQA